MEGNIAIQKAVTDSLAVDRDRIINELDEQQQYSRRNCLMLHGVKETAKEDVEKVVMNILDTKLVAGVLERDISRTHRIGRKQNDDNGKKERPIIVRFTSYRQRKQVFDRKKKLKGQNILITESLTKKRYSLLNKCF